MPTDGGIVRLFFKRALTILRNGQHALDVLKPCLRKVVEVWKPMLVAKKKDTKTIAPCPCSLLAYWRSVTVVR